MFHARVRSTLWFPLTLAASLGACDPVVPGDSDSGDEAGVQDEATMPAMGWSFGHCIGPCREELTFADDGDVSLVISSREGTVYLDNHAVLTAAGEAAIADAVRPLIGADLLPRYGCPDCADGGAQRIDLVRAGVETSHDYEYGNPPDALAEAHAVASEIRESLAACTAHPYVTLGAGCEPAQL